MKDFPENNNGGLVKIFEALHPYYLFKRIKF